MSTLHALLLLSVIAADSLGSGDHTLKITVDGRERSYLVHVPPQYDSKTPVVLVFHGGGSNADVMIRFRGLNKKSDDAGFIAVYPNGTGRLEKVLTFNGGNCCGYAMNNKVDDIEFTREILDDLAASANECNTEPVVTTIPDQAKDGTTITRKTYGSGKEGTEVVLVEIHGGGHTWYGQQLRLQFLGKSTKNISANDLMWNFFVKHPMK